MFFVAALVILREFSSTFFYFNSFNIFNSIILNVVSYLLSDRISFFLKNLFYLQLKMILNLKMESFCENKYAVNQDVFCCCSRHLPYDFKLKNGKLL